MRPRHTRRKRGARRAALTEVQPGEVLQFERLGYFAADLDDATVFHRTVGLRDEWARLQKRRNT